jgi:hypothetical protein
VYDFDDDYINPFDNNYNNNNINNNNNNNNNNNQVRLLSIVWNSEPRPSTKKDLTIHVDHSYDFMSEEELFNMSLTLHYDETFIDNNSDEDFQKNICTYCLKIFSRPDNVKRHQKNFCKKMIINLDDNYNKKLSTNIINNITNIDNHTNNQTNNIIIINANNNTLKPFDGDWTIEHIDSYLRQIILLSETKYTDLLDEILKNKENLNVIIEKDSNSGLVYKNENELYVNMKVKEIIDLSMQKLYDQLNSLYSNVLSNQISYKINTNLIENEKKILDNKFEDFCIWTCLKIQIFEIFIFIL